MSRILDIIAKFLSVVLYPLFVPTYGIVLFCYAHSLHVAPIHWAWVLVAILGTFILTCLIPISAIWIMLKRGEVKDMQIENPKERTVPYLYTALGFAFWAYLVVSILHAPLFLSFIAIGATAAIAIIAVINRFWKISAHLTGFGGLVGGIFTYCLGLGAIPAWGTLTLWLALTLILMGARLHLNAHTPAQVCAGWLLGLTSTFVPYCIYCYVS